MTATDELRRLLDERGVEWRDDSSIYGTRRTVWTADGVTYVAAEVSGRLKVSGYLTTAQAVEATLGRGTCHDTGEDDVRIDELNAENAELRELVRDFYPFASGRAAKPWLAVRRDRMRELGVDA